MGKCPFGFSGDAPPGHPTPGAAPKPDAAAPRNDLKDAFDKMVKDAGPQAADPKASNRGSVSSCPFSFGLFPGGREEYEDQRDIQRKTEAKPFDISKIKIKKNQPKLKCGQAPEIRIPLEALAAVKWDEAQGRATVTITPAAQLADIVKTVEDSPEVAAKELADVISTHGYSGAVAVGDAGAVEQLSEALYQDGHHSVTYCTVIDTLLMIHEPLENKHLWPQHKVHAALEVLLDDDEEHATRVKAALALMKTGGSGAIQRGGAVTVVVQLARSADPEVQPVALRCCGALAARGNGKALLERGVDKLLLSLIDGGDAVEPPIRESAARALGSLLHTQRGAGGIPQALELEAARSLLPCLDREGVQFDGLREAAARSMTRLATGGPDVIAAVMAHKGVARLVRQLSDGYLPAREAAARSLRALCAVKGSPFLAAASEEDGCVEKLIDLAQYGGHDGRVAASEALRILSAHEGVSKRVLEAGAVPPLVNMMRSCRLGEVDLPLEAARTLTEVAKDGKVAEAIVAARGVQAAVGLLNAGFHESRQVGMALIAQLELSGASVPRSKKASSQGGEDAEGGDSKPVDSVVATLVEQLADKTTDSWKASTAAATLMDLVQSDPKGMRARLCAAGVVPHLVRRAPEGIRSPDPIFGDGDEEEEGPGDETCGRLLASLAMERANKPTLQEHLAVKPLLRLLRHGSYQGRVAAAKALCNMGYSNGVASCEKGVPILVELAGPGTEDPVGQALAMQALIRISGKDNDGSLSIIAANGPAALLATMGHAESPARERAFAGNVLQNLLDGSYGEDAMAAVAKADGVKDLVELCGDDAAPAAVRAGAGAVLSYLAGKSDHATKMSDAGALSAMLRLLRSGEQDPEEVACAVLSFICAGEGAEADEARGKVTDDAAACAALRRIRKRGTKPGRAAALDALYAVGLERPSLLSRLLQMLQRLLTLNGLLQPIISPIEELMEAAAGGARSVAGAIFSGVTKVKTE